MTCRDATELIADYVEGHLPFRRRLSLRLHLALCRSCRNYFDSYRKTIQASRRALDEQPSPAPLPEDLIQKILAERSRDQRMN